MRPLQLDGAVPSRRVLLGEARRLGFSVTTGNGGEVRVDHPVLGRVNLNNRRKDGTRALIVLLKRARRELHENRH